jgi:hypothetical protein
MGVSGLLQVMAWLLGRFVAAFVGAEVAFRDIYE